MDNLKYFWEIIFLIAGAVFTALGMTYRYAMREADSDAQRANLAVGVANNAARIKDVESKLDQHEKHVMQQLGSIREAQAEMRANISDQAKHIAHISDELTLTSHLLMKVAGKLGVDE